MRPLKLTMTLFGPYKNKTVVDFASFDKNSLFLITGDTGSGKSTILDAISFALYGKSSTSNREFPDMRNKTESLTQSEQVIFECEINNENYTFSIEHHYSKKKEIIENDVKQKSTTITPKRLCYKANSDKIISGRTNVTAYATALLGLTYEQFSQMIILPQDEFKKFLLAKSDERGKILKCIFKTNFFSDCTNKIDTKQKDLSTKLQTINLKINTILNRYNVIDMSQFDDYLNEKTIKQHNIQCEKLQTKKELDEYTICYNNALSNESKFSQRDTFLKELNLLNAQKEQYNTYLTTIDDYKRYSELINLYTNYQTIQQQYIELEDKYKECKIRHNKNTLDFNKIEILQNENKQNENKISEINITLNTLENKLEQLAKSAKLLSEHNALTSHIAEKNRKLSTEKIEYNCQEDTIIELKNTISSDNEKVLQLPFYNNQLSILNDILHNLNEKSNLLLDLENYKHQEITYVTKISTLTEELSNQNCELTKLKKIMHENYALLLVDTLEENKPCPVCGSLSHPNPFSAVTSIFNPEKYKTINKNIEKNSTILNKLNSDLSLARHSIKNTNISLGKIENTISEKVNSLQNIFVNYDNVTIENTQLIINQKNKDISNLIALKEELKYKNIELLNCEKICENISLSIEKITEEIAKLSNEKALVEGQLTALKSENLPSSDEIELTKTILNRELHNLQEKNSSTTKIIEQYKELYTISSQQLKQLTSQFSDIKVILENSKTEYDTNCKKFGSVDSAQIKYLSSLDNEIEQYKTFVTQYATKKKSATDNYNKICDELANVKKLDIIELKKKLDERQRLNDEIIATFATINKDISNMQQDKLLLEKYIIEQKKIDDDYTLANNMYKLFDGKTCKKTTFEQYILAQKFSEVLKYANKHLSELSHNKFYIKQSDSSSYKGGGSKGLSIDIFDMISGQNRQIGTLSGGEMFLSSLSLALGLADVISHNAGGITMDSMFIDEGFGSLDTETRKLVMNILVNMKNNGMMIGIISHVESLKESIHNKIVVKRDVTQSSYVEIYSE